MAFIVDEETGNITLVQGDSGTYLVEDVPCDKNYTIYFGIYNDKRKPVGFEVSVDINRGGGDTPVYDNDLFAWNHSTDLLYSLSTDVVVGTPLYNGDNELTEYTVTSINSIIYNEGKYERDTADNINEYETVLYYFYNGYYTTSETPGVGDTIYDENGDETEYTVYEYGVMQAWVSEQSNYTFYTLPPEPEVGGYLFSSNGSIVNVPGRMWDITSVDENSITIDNTMIFERDNTKNIGYIKLEESDVNPFPRDEEYDVKEISSVDYYAWNNDGYIVYTIVENPPVNTLLYDDELSDIGRVQSIGSFLVETDEYLRNIANDIVVEHGEDIPTTNVEFFIPASLTDYLKVKTNEETATYYFGIKLCSSDGKEDTLLLGDSQIGDLNTITVYPKKVEGTING